jgi:hypothetical protein
MGLETTCRIQHGRTKWEAKVLLETDELRVRGERPFRVPLGAITRAESDGGVLRVEWGGDALDLELGDAARKWAERIRSPRSLLDKLGVKAGDEVVALAGLDAALVDELRGRASLREVKSAERLPEGAATIFMQANDRAALAPLHAVAARMARDGGVWVVHPKGKSGLADTVVFEVGKAAGLTAVKVARISDTLTAERLVIPKTAR